MNHRVTRDLSWLCAAVCVTLCAGSTLRAATEEELLTGTKDTLNVRAAQLLALDLDPDALQDFDVAIPIDGSLYTASLKFKTVRASNFKLLVQVEGGAFIEQEPGPVRTLKGTLAEVPGSVVAGSLLEDGLYLLIKMDTGERFWLEPIFGKVTGALPEHHALYRDTDVIGSGGWCKQLPMPGEALPGELGDHESYGSVSGSQDYIAQLACDTDVQYFQDYGSVAATENQIENIINTMNNQYEAQVDISHLITGIIVRTTEPDGYTSTNAETMLNEVSSNWSGKFPEIQRDVVQMFTGKNMNGSTIGIAWLNAVCKNLKYSAVESNCGGCFSFGCKTDLSAHELGHNWGASHCCPGTTMNSGLTCANNFAQTSINQIVAYRNTILGCLDLGNSFLRIVISGPTTVIEGAMAQYTAMAQYQFGDDVNVTNQTTWSVTPGSAGTINNQGKLTAAEQNGNLPATVTGFYTDSPGEDDIDNFAITVIDDDPLPDPRIANVTLSSSIPSNGVCEGQQFTVDVKVNALNGDIIDVRQLQLDTKLTSGLTIDNVEWVLEGLSDKSLYFLDNDPDVINAVYVGLTSIPGLIENFTATSKIMARLTLTYNGGVGSLNVCGVVNPPSADESARFQSEFDPPIDFTQALGNVLCGSITYTGGAGNCTIEIVDSEPPTDTIDARQTSNPDGSSPAGFSFVELTFDGAVDTLTPADFSISEDGGDGVPPTIIAVTPTGANTAIVAFSSAIQPVAWTQLTHDASGTSVTIGYLPGDVNADGTSATPDVLALVDHLNGVVTLPAYNTDIDRSGAVGPPDVLRVIDLLNGAGVYPPYNGISLP